MSLLAALATGLGGGLKDMAKSSLEDLRQLRLQEAIQARADATYRQSRADTLTDRADTRLYDSGKLAETRTYKEQQDAAERQRKGDYSPVPGAAGLLQNKAGDAPVHLQDPELAKQREELRKQQVEVGQQRANQQQESVNRQLDDASQHAMEDYYGVKPGFQPTSSQLEKVNAAGAKLGEVPNNLTGRARGLAAVKLAEEAAAAAAKEAEKNKPEGWGSYLKRSLLGPSENTSPTAPGTTPAPLPPPASGPARTGASTAKATRVSEEDIRMIAREVGADPHLLAAIVKLESGRRKDAVSTAGAVGPAQLMRAAAKDTGVDRTDPIDNLRGGARYLVQMLKENGGDIPTALAAYNAGPGAVKRAGGRLADLPFETQKYVPAVLAEYARLRAAGEAGQPPEGQAPNLETLRNSRLAESRPTPSPAVQSAPKVFTGDPAVFAARLVRDQRISPQAAAEEVARYVAQGRIVAQGPQAGPPQPTAPSVMAPDAAVGLPAAQGGEASPGFFQRRLNGLADVWGGVQQGASGAQSLLNAVINGPAQAANVAPTAALPDPNAELGARLTLPPQAIRAWAVKAAQDDPNFFAKLTLKNRARLDAALRQQ